MKPSKLTYMLLTLSAVFWGANFNAGKLVLDVMTPIQVAAWRFVIAGIGMLLILLVKERMTWSILRPNLFIYIVMGVTGIFLMNIFLFEGLKRTSAINTALIVGTLPLLTMCLSALFLREKLVRKQYLAIAVSLTGVLLVLTDGSFLQLGKISIGDLYVLIATLLWALYSILGKKYVRNSTPLMTTASTIAVGALCYLPFISFQYKTSDMNTIIEAWIALLFIAVCCSILAFLWWNEGIVRIGASKTSMFFNLVPVSTLLISAVTGEVIGSIQILGTFAAIAGIVLATRNPRAAH